MQQKAPPQIPVLTVTQLTYAVKAKLEHSFPKVIVKGEISNFKRQSSGHCYFTLKDQGAQLQCAMFRGSASALSRIPKEGDQVMAMGQLNVYPPRGQYQLVVSELQFEGLGALLLQLEELKKKLKGMGYFDPAIKKPLPPLPKRIGIVTSPTGAAIQDMINIISRRNQGFHLILNPVKVQGEGAAHEIAQAIEQFNKYKLADVLIIGRGGGSIEDLWAFNELVVAQAIYNSQIPIISAVGHETDVCISDYVADLRAPTPSAAAELVMQETKVLFEKLEQYKLRIHQSVREKARRYRQKLSLFENQTVFKTPYILLAPHIQKLDENREQLNTAIFQYFREKRVRLESSNRQLKALSPSSKLIFYREKLRTLHQSIGRAIKTALFEKQHAKLKELEIQFQTLNPSNLLQKGYSILFSQKDRSIITSISQIKTQDKLEASLSDGAVSLTVN